VAVIARFSVVRRSVAAYAFLAVLFLGAGEEFFLLGLAGFGDSAEAGTRWARSRKKVSAS
jgi:hypothetical protein